MAELTPEQMRALADDVDWYTGAFGLKKLPEVFAALRAAADQLEAVERWLWMQNGHLPGAAIEELSAILAADTAPQEGRDD